MWRTFFVSPVAGGVAAILGWTAAVLFQSSMTPAEFAELQFGWAGTIIGATALALILVLVLAAKAVEPLVMTVCAAFGVALLWDRTELPFTSDQVGSTEPTYWFVVIAGISVALLLAMGFRTTRETNFRGR